MLEIENYLKQASKSLLVAVIPFPKNDQKNYTDLIGFTLKSTKITNSHILNKLSTKLPNYFVPKTIIKIEEFPINSNGKIDYDKLYDFIK